MALGRQRRLVTAVAALAVALVAAIAHETYRIHLAGRFNAALVVGQASFLEDTPRARFAQAYALQQQGSFEEAMKLYGQLSEEAGAGLEAAVKYNLANLYLRHAMAAGGGEINDLAIPLIELAKENYRQLLRRNSQDWDAKFNLERALELLPEPEDEAPGDQLMPERSRRALRSQEAYQELP